MYPLPPQFVEHEEEMAKNQLDINTIININLTDVTVLNEISGSWLDSGLMENLTDK